ncbi:hypothetical protein S83_060672, partial [Arachis hypogaea]
GLSLPNKMAEHFLSIMLDHHNKVSIECEKDVELYRKSIERQRVHIFLVGLDCEFDQIRGDILRKDPIPKLEECYSLVRCESVRLATMKGESEKPEASALAEQDIEEKGPALVATASNRGHPNKGEYQEEVLTLDLQIPKEVELSTRDEVAELNAQDMDELNLGNGEHVEREVSSPSSASESLEPQETNTPNNHSSAEDAPDMAEPSRKQLPPHHTTGIPKPTYEPEISSKVLHEVDGEK